MPSDTPRRSQSAHDTSIPHREPCCLTPYLPASDSLLTERLPAGLTQGVCCGKTALCRVCRDNLGGHGRDGRGPGGVAGGGARTR